MCGCGRSAKHLRLHFLTDEVETHDLWPRPFRKMAIDCVPTLQRNSSSVSASVNTEYPKNSSGITARELAKAKTPRPHDRPYFPGSNSTRRSFRSGTGSPTLTTNCPSWATASA